MKEKGFSLRKGYICYILEFHTLKTGRNRENTLKTGKNREKRSMTKKWVIRNFLHQNENFCLKKSSPPNSAPRLRLCILKTRLAKTANYMTHSCVIYILCSEYFRVAHRHLILV